MSTILAFVTWVCQTIAALAITTLICFVLLAIVPDTIAGRFAAGLIRLLFFVPEVVSSFSGAAVGRVIASGLLASFSTGLAWLADRARQGLETGKIILASFAESPSQWFGRFVVGPAIACAITITSASRVIEWFEFYLGLGWVATLAVAMGTCYLLALGMKLPVAQR